MTDSSINLEDARLTEAPTDTQGTMDLVRRAQAGDRASFAALCERSRLRVWRIVASVAKGPDVDDLAQDAIVRAWCAMSSYRAEASFDAWLCRIALNAAHDHQRSAWKRKVIFWQDAPEEYDEISEPLEREVARREMQRRVRRAVASLPSAQRDPIWLHFFEGFSVAEIARLEAISESTLRSRVQAGMKRLARTLGDIPEGSVSSQAPLRLEAESKGCTLCD